MLQKSLFFLSLTFCLTALASIPTPEGLFRNGNNQDINGSIVSLKFSVEKMNSSSVEQFSKTEPLFYKIIFNLNDDSTVDFYQLNYIDNKMKESQLASFKIINKFAKKVTQLQDSEKSLFYSVFLMLALNQSTPIAHNLKKIDRNFPLNESLINEDQLKLYEKQKKYLTQIKNGQISSSNPSPLKPSNDEERVKINEVLNSDMYKKTEYVNLEKTESGFYWVLKMDKIFAKFTNDEHRLSEFKVELPDGEVQYDLSNYVLFNGVHELPKLIIYQALNGERYKVRPIGLAHGMNIEKRTIEALKKLEAERPQKAQEDQFIKAPFLY